jgi:hypothetical protein
MLLITVRGSLNPGGHVQHMWESILESCACAACRQLNGCILKTAHGSLDG